MPADRVEDPVPTRLEVNRLTDRALPTLETDHQAEITTQDRSTRSATRRKADFDPATRRCGLIGRPSRPPVEPGGAAMDAHLNALGPATNDVDAEASPHTLHPPADTADSETVPSWHGLTPD